MATPRLALSCLFVFGCAAAVQPVPSVSIPERQSGPVAQVVETPLPPPTAVCDSSGSDCVEVGRTADQRLAFFGRALDHYDAERLAELYKKRDDPSPHGRIDFVYEPPPNVIAGRVVPGTPVRAVIHLDAPLATYPRDYAIEIDVNLRSPWSRGAIERCATFRQDGSTKEGAERMLARDIDLVLITSGDDGGALTVPRECTLAMRHAMLESNAFAVAIGVTVRITSPQQQTLATSELVFDLDKDGLERTVSLDKRVEAARHHVPSAPQSLSAQ